MENGKSKKLGEVEITKDEERKNVRGSNRGRENRGKKRRKWKKEQGRRKDVN
jgi:hypothetical protein